MSDENRLSRREFLRDAAIAGAAIAATTWLSPTQAAAAPVPDKWDKEADVVVVGFGGAGASAAIEAADAGAKVLLLDKMPTPGGNSTLSAGAFIAPGSSVQKAFGFDDTPEKAYRYWMKGGMGVTDPELTRAVVENAAATLDWLTKLMGGDAKAIWNCVYCTAYEFADEEDAIPRTHMTGGRGAAEFAAVQKAVAQRSSIQVLMETRAISLVTNTNAEVVGVKAQAKDGKESYFKAARAVVLTTGDFSRNDEMAKAYSMETYLAVKNTYPGATGDGILMAQELGAALVCMEGTMGGGTAPGTILVNDQGARYVNEGCRFKNTGVNGYWKAYRTFQQHDHKGFGIVDGTAAEKGGKGLKSSYSDDLAEEIKNGLVVKADTIEDLAIKCGMVPAILRATVDMWNQDLVKGADRLFGRRTGRDVTYTGTVPTGSWVAGTSAMGKPIEKPPFYAITPKGQPETTITTHGGVKTNGKAQVINVRGQVIRRLYAAGSTVGGFLGPFYQQSGGGLAQAYTMGRISGKNAAAEKPWDAV